MRGIEMRKRIVIAMVMVLSVLLFSGCTTKAGTGTEIPQLNEKIAALEVQVKGLEEENAALEAAVRTLEEAKTVLTRELEALKSGGTVTEPGSSVPVEYYPIYAMDVDSMQRITVSFTGIERTRNLRGKLEEVSRALSSEVFEKLTIDLKEVTTIDGKEIATFNLKDVPGIEKAWGEIYFQGSTGGSATIMALTDTLLQKDYQGEWVDGVKFLYEDQAIEFEHVESLGETFYRE
jgi:outer membrane murein-binding lipoprotein Lpp